MTDHDAFIRTICERTAQGLDTTAERLIFADWLQKHGGARPLPDAGTQGGMKWRDNGYAERAEFIRLQVQIATPWTTAESPHGECWQCYCARNGHQHTNGRCKCSDGWKDLRRREKEILATNVSRWIDGPHNPLLGMRPDQIEWRGGFPAKVRCSFREWFGDVCPTCQGGNPLFCSGACEGTGRVNALGLRIVACCPIEEFKATDDMQSNTILAWRNSVEDNRRALEWARKKWLEKREANVT